MQQDQRLYYLQKMGIQTWIPRHPAAPPELESQLECIDNPVGNDAQLKGLYNWDELNTAIAGCHCCAQACDRQQAIMGLGEQQADCLVIGEAPNPEEDEQGHPFAGESGALLREVLKSIGLTQDKVYLTNIVKCKPNEGQSLDQVMIDHCQSYLHQQITLINPKFILLLGRVAAHTILDCASDMSELRGRLHEFSLGDSVFPVIVSYHPAYLLRKPSQKRLVWQDMLLLQESLIDKV